MDEHDRTTTLPRTRREGTGADGTDNVVALPGAAPPRRRRWPFRRRRKRIRVRKLRVLALLFGLGLLGIVSAVFGMLMAVASDLPTLEEPSHLNSLIEARDGSVLDNLTGSQNRVSLRADQIATVMKDAIISIEDSRFYTNNGVDLRGIARAAVQDLTNKRAAQGASTIPQQFVKLTLAAQNNRTILEKLREAAMAYHLSRKWSKQRILRDYLNTIYFGNGAYGIEAAARTYFGTAHPDCGHPTGKKCASELTPPQAALLAGIVQNPSGYDPVAHPQAARHRRNTVLQHMLVQHYLTRAQYSAALAAPLPTAKTLTFAADDSKDAYFTSWVKQQVVDKLGGGQQGAQRAFNSGLVVKTTIDPKLQSAAEAAVRQWLPNPSGPQAALVAISNTTGEVRAMVGGTDYGARPFNLATQGQRQPGSSFKPFVLAQALAEGVSPESTWESKPRTYVLTGGEHFTVHNDDDSYAGVTTLTSATTYSDNTVYVQVGKQAGRTKVASLARHMGIRTPVSTNFTMSIGGLHEGVTPLDMAHAYETFANDGRFTYGSLSPGQGHHLPVPGPVGIDSISKGGKPVKLRNGKKAVNHVRHKTVLDPGVAQEVGKILQTVVQKGTGTAAQIPGVTISGKTGTTDDYADAWFVGWTHDYTVAVWVGYPDKFKPMKSEYQGGPVSGGTFPAQIWHSFMTQVLKWDPVPKAEPGQDSADGSGAGSSSVEGAPTDGVGVGTTSDGSGGATSSDGTATGGDTSGAGGSAGSGTGSAGGGTGTGTTGGDTGTGGGTTGGGSGTTAPPPTTTTPPTTTAPPPSTPATPPTTTAPPTGSGGAGTGAATAPPATTG